MAKIAVPTTIGTNPLESLVPLSPTLAAVRAKRAPADQTAASRTMQLAVNLSPTLVARLQGVAGITTGVTVDSFCEDALLRHLGATGVKRASPVSKGGKKAKTKGKAKGKGKAKAKAKPKTKAKGKTKVKTKR